MKQYLILLVLPVIALSCKKDNDAPKELLLNEVYEDGKLQLKFRYDGQNRFTTSELYYGPANSLSARSVITYDNNGHMSSTATYDMPGEIPVSRGEVTCDEMGRPVRIDSYDLAGPSPNTPQSYGIYVYNSAGRLTQVTRRDKNDELLSRSNVSYFDDGNIKEVTSYQDQDGQLWMISRTAFSITADFKPIGTSRLLPVLGPDFVASLYSESIQSFSYDQNGVITFHMSIIMSGREFNEDGSLKRQAQTRKRIVPAGTETVVNRSYEYITQ